MPGEGGGSRRQRPTRRRNSAIAGWATVGMGLAVTEGEASAASPEDQERMPVMQNPSTIALSRVVAQQRLIDITANNIANTATTGYRSERMLFGGWMSRQLHTDAPRGGQTIAYTEDKAIYRDTNEGALSRTGNPLDLAIKGDGYFTVATTNGPRLTRAGHFSLDASGNIIDANGNTLLDTSGQALQVASSDAPVTIARDGTISGANGQIGQIGLVAPSDPTAMQTEGGQRLRATGPTAPVAAPVIIQGMVEQSNVKPVVELTSMMEQSRNFEFATQFIQEEDNRQMNAITKIMTPA